MSANTILPTDNSRIRYIKSTYTAARTESGFVARINGRDVATNSDWNALVSHMRRHHGHFNFADESGAFADIYPHAFPPS